jgi:dihydroorotate dehydrogenase electron transfer subunit
MKKLKVKILSNRRVADGFYNMRVGSSYLARASKPGQFLEVKCSEGIEPLLRRPLGVHRIGALWVEMLYEVVGSGTRMLSQKKPAESLDLIGPLGNGFVKPARKEAAIIAAGGVGVAPLTALAEELTRAGRKVSVVIGAKTKKHILCEGQLCKFGCTVRIATEDGSKGYKGLATDLLRKMLASSSGLRATMYACGPSGMLKAVTRIAKEKKMSCQVSLEERMACGVGVCLGCPVKVKSGGYKMVCKDGPVFNAEEIAW